MADSGSNFISEKFQVLLQKPKHRASSHIISPPSEQRTGGGMHQILKIHSKEIF